MPYLERHELKELTDRIEQLEALVAEQLAALVVARDSLVRVDSADSINNFLTESISNQVLSALTKINEVMGGK